MENKKQFVENISKALVGAPGISIEKVDYEKYQSEEGWTQEYVVVYYKGGSIACRNVNATSCGAIYQEIGKMIFGGYYEEVRERERVYGSPKWTKVE